MLSVMLTSLISNGLSTLAEAVFDKGEKYVADKVKDMTGLDISKGIKKEDVERLKEKEADILAKLTENNRHSEKLLSLALDEEKLANEDRSDARDLNKVYVESEDRFISRFVPIFALVIIVFGFSLLTLMIFSDIPNENTSIATKGAELVSYVLISVISFFFGRHATPSVAKV